MVHLVRVAKGATSGLICVVKLVGTALFFSWVLAYDLGPHWGTCSRIQDSCTSVMLALHCRVRGIIVKLSSFGSSSLFMILSYMCFKDLRGNARTLLVCLFLSLSKHPAVDLVIHRGFVHRHRVGVAADWLSQADGRDYLLQGYRGAWNLLARGKLSVDGLCGVVSVSCV